MNTGSQDRTPSLRIVGGSQSAGQQQPPGICPQPASRDVDWSILMARAQTGDGSAYRSLLEDITPYLRSLASRRHAQLSDVEDAVQDILLTVHTIRATYDPMRPFGPWLVAIANRRLVDRLRRQGRQKVLKQSLTYEQEISPDAETDIDAISDRQRLAQAIESLPEGQKNAVHLLKIKELTLQEAAAASDMSIGSLKASMHRALISLRKILTDRSEM